MASNIQLTPMINAVPQNSWILLRLEGAPSILTLAFFVCQPRRKHGRILRRQDAPCHRFKRWLSAVLDKKYMRKRSPWRLRPANLSDCFGSPASRDSE